MNSFPAFLRPLVCVVLLLASAPGSRSAETAATAPKPLLWKIGTPTPSYVFGTIHLADPRVVNYGPAVSNALARADVVVTEIEMDPAALAKVAETLMNAKKPLSEVLPKDLLGRLDKELKRIMPALSVEPFDRMHVWAMAATVSLLEEQMKGGGGQPSDMVLASRAKAAGKKTAGLETIEEQVGTFDTLTEAEQVTMLRETLDTMEKARKEGRNPIDELKRAYLSGDPETLMAKMHEWMEDTAPDQREKFLKAFLTDRNERMLERSLRLMRGSPDKAHFIAVGAAHLPAFTSK